MNRTDRLIGILLELQGRGEVTAAALAARFEVGVRTIYRDVQALCEEGVPVVATPGRGYRLQDGYYTVRSIPETGGIPLCVSTSDLLLPSLSSSVSATRYV